MKVVFYYGSQDGQPIKITNIEKGNPGIGGTQYLILLLAYYLAQDKSYDVAIVGVREVVGLQGVDCISIRKETELKTSLTSIGTEILITYHFPHSCLEEDLYNANFKIIVWSHNFLYSDFCDYIVKNESIKCNVFVGKQQYDWYIDDDVIKKSVNVFNMMPDVVPANQRKNDSKTVVFLGLRGIIEVCKCWKKVLEAVPNAQLYVMGSEKLYENVQLGKYGVARSDFENQFMPYVTDQDGSVIPSVHFLGLVNEEKLDYFQKASVGIINPSGCHETFGMGIVEMGVAELPVVTSTSNGYYDTVISGTTGYICTDVNDLSDKIIYLLKHPDKNKEMGENGKKNAMRFSPDIIIPQWKKLIEDVYNDHLGFLSLKPSKPYTLDFKYMRMFNSFLRFTLRLKFLPSLIKIQCTALQLLKKYR